MTPVPPGDHPTDHTGADTDLRKSELRRRLRDRRATLAATPARALRDAAVVDHLCRYLDDSDTAGDPRPVAAFAPLPGEPGGADLPDRLLATGRQVWLPVVDGPGRPLRWLPYIGPEHQHTAAFGIREPVPVPELTGTGAPVALTDIPGPVDIVLPALAVDADGTRLGQGGGFYDRTLTPDTLRHLWGVTSHPDSPRRGRLMALVDHEEFGMSVPRTELDLAVPVVVTEDGVSPTGGRR